LKEKRGSAGAGGGKGFFKFRGGERKGRNYSTSPVASKRRKKRGGGRKLKSEKKKKERDQVGYSHPWRRKKGGNERDADSRTFDKERREERWQKKKGLAVYKF